jgi:hypothetical protein
MSPDYPIITATVAVKQTAPLGLVAPLTIDANTSFWQDLFGRNYPAEFKPGTVTVSAGLSVRNLVPGGGNVAAGSVVRMTGTGFVPATAVKIDGVDLASVRYSSPSELDLIVKSDANLQSKRVRVTNPDKSQVEYYSYLRGIETSPSAFGALANVRPIFPDKALSGAIFAAPAQLPWAQGLFTAVAVQNPNPLPTDVTVVVYSVGGGVAVSSTTVAVAPGARMTRELTELLGELRGLPPRFLVILSPQPVQMVGIVGDTTVGTVLPLAPLVAR